MVNHFFQTKRKDKIVLNNNVSAIFASVQKIESIGTLAGGIALDFNNNLGIILGNSSFMERGLMSPDKPGFVVICITYCHWYRCIIQVS